MKRIRLLLTLLAALLLSGCAMRDVQEMYALPRRSEEFSHLQSAIDAAMAGLAYSAPVSGENQQTVQSADLDGDGVEEYLVFAAGNSERPLQVLIFRQNADGGCSLQQVIQSNGTAFDQVEYVQFDERPGYELVIGRQVGDQMLRSISVYSFSGGSAEQLLLAGYSKFLTCDLDGNGRGEVLVFRPGEAQAERGVAVLYNYRGGQVERSVELELAGDTGGIRRATVGKLQDDTPAVYVSSVTQEEISATDILVLRDGRLTNLASELSTGVSIHTLHNYYIYAEDIDEDGVMELPSQFIMKPVSQWQESSQRTLLRWFSVDMTGNETDKMFSFHYYPGGWYMPFDSSWARRVSVEQGDNLFIFYVWDEAYQTPTVLFTIYVFTGSDRDEEAVSGGRFALYRAEGVAYAAKLDSGAEDYGITEAYLKDNFRLIRQDWRTGETEG